MTAQQFKEIRAKLDLTQRQLGLVLGLKAPDRNIRFYESGRPISGALAVAMRYMARHGLDKLAKEAAGLK